MTTSPARNPTTQITLATGLIGEAKRINLAGTDVLHRRMQFWSAMGGFGVAETVGQMFELGNLRFEVEKARGTFGENPQIGSLEALTILVGHDCGLLADDEMLRAIQAGNRDPFLRTEKRIEALYEIYRERLSERMRQFESLTARRKVLMDKLQGIDDAQVQALQRRMARWSVHDIMRLYFALEGMSEAQIAEFFALDAEEQDEYLARFEDAVWASVSEPQESEAE